MNDLTLARVEQWVAVLNDSRRIPVRLFRFVPGFWAVVDYDFFTRRILISAAALRLPEPILEAKLLRALGYARHPILRRFTVTALCFTIILTLMWLILQFGHWSSLFMIEFITWFACILALKAVDKECESEVEDWARSKMRDYDVWK